MNQKQIIQAVMTGLVAAFITIARLNLLQAIGAGLIAGAMTHYIQRYFTCSR